jgi:hypothetical protein
MRTFHVFYNSVTRGGKEKYPLRLQLPKQYQLYVRFPVAVTISTPIRLRLRILGKDDERADPWGPSSDLCVDSHSVEDKGIDLCV